MLLALQGLIYIDVKNWGERDILIEIKFSLISIKYAKFKERLMKRIIFKEVSSLVINNKYLY